MTNYELKLARIRGRTKQLNAMGLNRRGQPLQVRKWRQLDRLGLRGKAREAMRRKLVMQERVLDGLTTRGTQRVRKQWPELRGKSRSEKNTTWHRDWLQRRRYFRGLTARGTTPLASILPPAESRWRELRATMGDMTLPELTNAWVRELTTSYRL